MSMEDSTSLSAAMTQMVSAKADAAKHTVEHTVINADANMSASKGSALDLLGGSSTVTVTNDGLAVREY